MKMDLELKRFIWPKMKLDKPHIVAKLVTNKTITFVVPKTTIVAICCNPSLGLATEAKGCKVVGQDKDPRVTSHALGNAKSVRE
jgi:hypothetical protein